MPNCIFCNIIAGNAPGDVLYQDDKLVVFKDIKPASKFHFLAVPKAHIVSVNSLTQDDVQLIEELIAKGMEVLKGQGGDDTDVRLGFHLPPFNSINHLHLHVISPIGEMSALSRLVFRPNSWWFSTVEHVLEKLSNVNKL